MTTLTYEPSEMEMKEAMSHYQSNLNFYASKSHLIWAELRKKAPSEKKSDVLGYIRKNLNINTPKADDFRNALAEWFRYGNII